MTTTQAAHAVLADPHNDALWRQLMSTFDPLVRARWLAAAHKAVSETSSYGRADQVGAPLPSGAPHSSKP